jgi:hypothetical protein
VTRFILFSASLALVLVIGMGSSVYATILYGGLAGGIPGGFGPGVAPPSVVPGKEYSHDMDQETAPPGGILDPQQVIAWDGSGGVADGVDFSLTRPNYEPDDQVDAIANRGDHLFKQLLGGDDTVDNAHLIFSHDDMISLYTTPPGGGVFPSPFLVPSAGPVSISNGNLIGGAGELSVETAFAFTPASSQGFWATQASINFMPRPVDVDGVEVWGPEPAFTADADKYSLDVDFFSGTSVWSSPTGSSYISHSAIVAAVTSLLGPVGSGVLPYPTFIDGDDAINLDALMVKDIIPGEGDANDTFDRDPAGGIGDRIIFSIRQIINPSDPTGYYATGSELFVLDASGAVSFLKHGGHVWDKAYALTDLVLPATLVNGLAVIDINAIEAISQGVVPEPTSAVLMLFAMAACGLRRR